MKLRLFVWLVTIPIYSVFGAFTSNDHGGDEELIRKEQLSNRHKAVEVLNIRKEYHKKYPRGYRIHYKLRLTSLQKEIGFYDAINSSHAVNPKGIRYLGEIDMDKDLLEPYEQVYRLAYKVLFAHEGKYDAINTYDRGVFSFGFIQNNAKYGELSLFMKQLSLYYPEAYYRYFGERGIEVNRDEEGSNMIQVVDDTGKLLMGDAAWKYMSEDVKVIACFIEAAHDVSIRKMQREFLHERYTNLLLERSAKFHGKYYTWGELMGADEKLLAAAVTLGVNLGVGGANSVLQKALNEMSALYKSPDQINMELFLRQIRSIGNDDRVTRRINMILEAN
ncbi:hypothetical protein V6R21_31170 [Limibacter armeniacum]|uniref:hypothetical protein n=1 Tax=Limibacter armeniacum TaxID=466084 RepID=UPI002FE526E6